MHSNLGIEPEHVLVIPSVLGLLSRKVTRSLMKMGLGLASSPRFALVALSSVSGSRYSKHVSQRVFKYLIHGSESDWINSSNLLVSSSLSFKWLVDIMFTERLSKILPMLTSESHDDVADELS